jgi:signal transduction histidine kinase
VWAITRDITPLKQTEIGLKQAEVNLRIQNAELNQLNSDLDTFFDTVSHDLYGPLNNVKGLVDMLKVARQDELTEITQMLESSVQRFDDVLTGLTEIIKLKNKHEQSKEVELDAVLKVVQAELSNDIARTGTTFSADFSECPTVRYTRSYVESLFRNMISNSLKYKSVVRAPHIQIKSGMAEGYVTLTFQDNGMGINLEQNRDKIFKPFQQLDSKRQGKGMGLSIVKNILERKGGWIDVKSELDVGTTFICYLKNESK